MSSGKQKPWYIFVLGALILLIVAFGDELSQRNLILPVVVLLFVFCFGVLLWQGLKRWKKTDDEILAEFSFSKMFSQNSAADSPQNPIKSLLLGAIFSVFVLYKTDFTLPSIIFCCIAMLLSAAPLIHQLLEKRNQNRSVQKRRISGQHIVAFLIGLIPSLFVCVLCGVGIYHGVWWFIVPPGLVFLVFFSRPLVAAVRTVIRNLRGEGAQHLRTRKDIDPWERPDIDPEKYRRK